MTSPAPLVVWLGEAADPELVGSKAASLAALLRDGLPVPDGFCLTTGAFRMFSQASGLDHLAADLLRESAPGPLELVAQRLQDTVRTAHMPQEVAVALAAAYARLASAGGGPPPVAVRSSAPLEDLVGASFAGQYESFLNVVGLDQLLDRVKDCWASLYTARALRYRADRRLGQHSLSMAVLVQRMLDPVAAGVAFTADPVSGARGQVQVHAAYGLGEAVASGQVDSDRFTFAEPGLELLSLQPGVKRAAVRPAPGGGAREQDVDADQARAPCLSGTQARAVAAAAARVAELRGSPQDVEWAIEDGRVYLLQARPMVFRAEPTWESPVPGAHWRRNWRLGEWLSEPVSPLFATSLLPRLIEGREQFGAKHLGWDQPPAFSMLTPWYCIVNGYFFTRDDRDEGSRTLASGMPQDRAARMRAQTEWLRLWRRRRRPAYRRRLRRLQAFDPQRASPRQVLGYLETLYRDAAEWWYLLARIGFGFEATGVDRWATDGAAPGRSPLDLYRGFPNQAVRGQQLLYELAERIRASPVLRAAVDEGTAVEAMDRLAASTEGQALLTQLDDFRQRFGHQVFTLDYAAPTLGESAEAVIAALRSYLRQASPSPRQRFERQRRRRYAVQRHFRAHPPVSPDALPAWRATVQYRQECARVREDAFFDFQRLWPLMRRAVVALGSRLAEAGSIPQPLDVFFLEHDELWRAAAALDAGAQPGEDFRDRVAERRATWDRQRRLRPPDRLPVEHGDGWSAPVAVQAADWGTVVRTGKGRELRGQVASAGYARGPARVVRTAEDLARVQPGDVLVAVTASPAWTVVFPLVAGVVTEVGGPATHSSLVAREYGIPAVVSTGIATQVIADGQMIGVDGSRGAVELDL